MKITVSQWNYKNSVCNNLFPSNRSFFSWKFGIQTVFTVTILKRSLLLNYDLIHQYVRIALGIKLTLSGVSVIFRLTNERKFTEEVLFTRCKCSCQNSFQTCLWPSMKILIKIYESVKNQFLKVYFRPTLFIFFWKICIQTI